MVTWVGSVLTKPPDWKYRWTLLLKTAADRDLGLEMEGLNEVLWCPGFSCL